MIVVEGELGRGAIVFYLLFWVLNEGGGGSGKNTPNIFLRGASKNSKGKNLKSS